jgi:cytochrome c
MKAFASAVAVSLSILTMPLAALAAEKGTAEQAVAMTKKAIALIKSAGKEKAFAEFADPANAAFHDRDLYVYVYDLNGVTLAHGNNPKMVGKNLIDMKDSEGKAIIKGFIDTANSPAGKGWVEYKWPNPTTKAIEQKAGYVEKVDSLIVGSGIYK